MNKTVVYTNEAPIPIGPYSQAVIVGGVLYGSGQIALIPQTDKIEKRSIEDETMQVMKNIGSVLKAAGMGYSNIVKTSILLSDMSLFVKVNEVYGSFFKKDPPARETYAVNSLPKNVNIEISFIACT